MHFLFFSILLKFHFYRFADVIFVCFLLMLLLFVFTIAYAVNKKRSRRNKELWYADITTIISQAIFSTNKEDDPVDISYRIEMLLHNKGFRNTLINELIHAKKNLSGSSTLNLVKLYEVLQLDKNSLTKLHSSKWHIKAKGIQELAMLDQKKYVKEIFRLTNNPNVLVRNEAQCALISFYGYQGLRFLNVASYPISQWQQIQLLNKLGYEVPKNFESVKNWLQSSNESVKIFALKLATVFNCYEVYENVINCLQIDSLQVRLNALEYLKKLPHVDTADNLIANYFFKSKIYKLAVIVALKDTGSEKQIPFLLKQLHDNDDDIKAAAARSLTGLHPSGVSFLQNHLFADENPWKAIFLHIKNERAA